MKVIFQSLSNPNISDQLVDNCQSIEGLIPSSISSPPQNPQSLPPRGYSDSLSSNVLSARPSLSLTLPLPRSASTMLENKTVVEEFTDKSVHIDVIEDEDESESSVSKQPLLDFGRMREIEEYLHV